MKFPQSQRGVSLLSWAMILILAGFFFSVGFKLLPHYMDNRALTKMITAVEQDNAAGGNIRSVNDFYAYIEKSMQVNSIRGVSSKDILDIRLEGSEFYVHMDYEQREKVLKNIDVVVSFDKEFRVRAK